MCYLAILNQFIHIKQIDRKPRQVTDQNTITDKNVKISRFI